MTDDLPKVEKSVRYETKVQDLSQAWAVVMAHVDEFKQPNVAIDAVYDDDSDDFLFFEVAVHGDVQG